MKSNSPGFHKIIFTSACIALSAAGTALSVDYGTAKGQILEFTASARAAALGDAPSGAERGLPAAGCNPAGVSGISGTELQFSHILHFLDTSMSSLGFGQGLGRGGIMISLKQFRAGDTARDSLGREIESFNIVFEQYSVGAGFPLGKGQSLGAALNVLSEEVYSEKTFSAGFDLGWLYSSPGGNSIGFSVKNIEREIGEDDFGLPFICSLAGGHGFLDYFRLYWDVSASRQYGLGFKSGVQADVSGILALRAGFRHLTVPEATFGFGVRKGLWTLDYAFLPHFDLGTGHRFSLGLGL